MRSGTGEQRHERRKYPRKKIRILIKYKGDSLYESFTYDASLSGVFVLADSPEIFSFVRLGMELEFFLEYDLDVMIRAEGVVRRIQDKTATWRNRHNGFALEISRITEANKKLLSNIISAI